MTTQLTHIKVTAFNGRIFAERIERLNPSKTPEQQAQDIIAVENLDRFQNIVWDICDAEGNVPEDNN